MTINNQMTQSEMIELNLQLLENERIDTKNKHTLYKLLPHYVSYVDNEHILFFNKYYEVVLDFSNYNSQSFFNQFNKIENEDYYKEAENFDYLFIEAVLPDTSIYFYNSFETILNKKYHSDYIKRVRKFIELLNENKCIKENDMKYFRLKTNYY